MIQRLPAEVATLYAELLELLTLLAVRRSIGHAAGSFVEKHVKDQDYCYFQHSVPGGATRQIYLGRKTPELDAVVARFASERADLEAERANVERLCALLRVGGAAVTDHASARVIAALADSAIFHLGGILVGTHAFVVAGNMLGVQWERGSLRTEDVDVAAVGERGLAVAVPDVKADVPRALAALEMGFFPVPGLSRSEPSTSFKVRGRPLRVDLITPAVGRPRGPIVIERFGAAAAPLPYLDYLLEDAQPAAIVDGGGVLVHVPHPARLALHKLIVARSRAAAFQTKSEKDVRQASCLIEVLAEDRPADLAAAWQEVLRRGPRWRRAVEEGAGTLARRFPHASEALQAVVRRHRRRGA